jgi:hypothetical protein
LVVVHERLVRPARGRPRWVRRILIALILLTIVASVIGAIVSIVQGDPIDREFGEASNQLDVAMDRLSELGIACSKNVVGEVDPGGASSGAGDRLRLREQLRVRPEFSSRRYGLATYGQLAETCAGEMSAGAHDESEMGAFHDLFQPQRAANLRARLSEFTPAGFGPGLRVAPEGADCVHSVEVWEAEDVKELGSGCRGKAVETLSEGLLHLLEGHGRAR